MLESELQTLKGTIENVVFRNENNGWTVLEMNCDDELVTVVGTVAQVSAGEEFRVTGNWVNHPSYGRQFRAETVEQCLPAALPAILKYLSSGAIKGMGPSTAKRVVDAFKDETFHVIENSPQRLAEIKGISPKKAMQISESFKSQFGIRTAMLFLQKYEITTAEAIRIWKRLGPKTVDMVRENPYLLCSSGLSISFEKADSIAMEMGFDHESGIRIRAGVTHVLRHNFYTAGHTCIPEEQLARTAARLLGCGPETVETETDNLVEEQELFCETVSGKRMIFLPEAHTAESYISGRLTLMLRVCPFSPGACGDRIAEAEKQFGITYAAKQREAIETAYNKGVMILTGGPGTGKTTTINAIIKIYESMGLKVVLAAPTGRAAKRMSEVSGLEAKTIHRLLEIEYQSDDTPRFSRNERNPLDCDALIVDELSMVDVLLFESLLRAMKLSCRLVMVGDADQLPPVGPGNLLRDMIKSGRIPCVALDEIFRQASQSLIVTNAHRIVKGEMPELACRDKDFFLLTRYTPAQVMSTVRDLVETRLPAAYGYSPMWDIQVLAPGRKGELGTMQLNSMLQQALNPPSRGKAELHAGGRVLREGDKVMQIKNNYDLVWEKENSEHGSGIFNGDIGALSAVDRRTGRFQIHFDDRTAGYAPENIEEIEPAYAITVHKSQGSEFKAVVLPLFSGAPQLFYRNLLYTAVTRARELVIIVGREGAVAEMVRNNKKTKRYSALEEFLIKGLE